MAPKGTWLEATGGPTTGVDAIGKKNGPHGSEVGADIPGAGRGGDCGGAASRVFCQVTRGEGTGFKYLLPLTMVLPSTLLCNKMFFQGREDAPFRHWRFTFL